MTNQEAIEELQLDIEMMLFDPSTGEVFEEYRLNEEDRKQIKAKRMAIRALEQEPCEDAVSREEALLCLTGTYTDEDYKIDEYIGKFAKRIKALPSVQPQTADMDFQSGFNAGKSVGLYESQTVDWDGMIEEIENKPFNMLYVNGGIMPSIPKEDAIKIINKYRNGEEDG